MHFFGGRLHTGSGAEFVVAEVVVALAALATWHTKEGFMPYLYDWATLYDAGLIDAAEWRANRFSFL